MNNTANGLIVDAFTRIQEEVHRVARSLNVPELTFRPSKSANSISWLLWHLSRIQDDHISDLAASGQVWYKEWAEKFNLPFDRSATGYGQSAAEVAAVKVDSKLLLGYHDAVYAQTVKFINGLKDEDYEKIVDRGWNPPVTLATRLISVISDDLQHVGQAAYIRGFLSQYA